MTSPTWRALGQVVIVYFAINGSAVTAQDLQPGRATFAEMVAFARLASVPCKRLAPDVEGFHALVLQRLIKPPLAPEEIAAKEKDVKRLRDRLGLSRWCKRYAGQMEQARILVQVSTKAELAASQRSSSQRVRFTREKRMGQIRSGGRSARIGFHLYLGRELLS
jgi:hypothetical protein